MGEFADIYIAIKTRSKQEGIDFLDHFLPKRKESTDEYEYPQYSQITEQEFTNVNDLMTFLELTPNAEYDLYWQSTDDLNPNRHGMLFYTKDEALIFGISRDADIGGHLNTENEDHCLCLMKDYFHSEIGYITYENTPIETYEKFKKLIDNLQK